MRQMTKGMLDNVLRMMLFCVLLLVGLTVFAQFDPDACNSAPPTGVDANSITSGSTGSSTAPLLLCPSTNLESSFYTFKLPAVTVDVGDLSEQEFQWVIYGGIFNAFNGDVNIISDTTICSVSGVSRSKISKKGVLNDTCYVMVEFDDQIVSDAWIAVRQISEFSCTDSTWSVFYVNVNDNIAPSITAPADIVIETDNEIDLCIGSLTVGEIGSPIVSDNCDNNLNTTYSRSDGEAAIDAPFDVGSTIIRWKVQDYFGNIDSVDQTIIVEDLAKPHIGDCKGDDTRNTDVSNSVYTINSGEFNLAVLSDNCALQDTTYSLSGATTGTGFNSLDGVTLNMGTTNIEWVVSDVNGNDSTCTFDVTVQDNELPQITCPANIDQDNVDLACGVLINSTNLVPVSYSDNHKVDSVYWTITGANNAASPKASAIEALGDFTFLNGVSTIEYTVKDSSGNAEGCIFTVTINDVIPPEVTPPANVAVNLVTNCNIVVDHSVIGSASYFDYCDNDVSVDSFRVDGTLIDQFYNFPLDTSYIGWIGIDDSGNRDTAYQQIVVRDLINPVIDDCRSDIYTTTDAGFDTRTAVGDEFDIQSVISDNCTVLDTTYVLSGATTGSGNYSLDGVVFNMGTTTVLWTVNDTRGNSTTCQYDIIVADNEPPVVVCPDDTVVYNIEGTCLVSIDFDPPSFTDNDGVDSLYWIMSGDVIDVSARLIKIDSLNVYNNFTYDVSTITYIVKDSSNNQGSCSFTVTVIDTIKPQITCPSDYDVGFCHRDTGIVIPSVSDNCEVFSLVNDLMVDNWLGDADGYTDPIILNVGDQTINWTGTDARGNEAYCSYSIHVNQEAVINSVDYSDVSCNGDSDGMLVFSDVFRENGTNIEYSSDGVWWQSDSIITNLFPGTYTPRARVYNVYDTCYIQSAPIVIGEPSEFTVSAIIDSVTCAEDNDGTIDLTVSGSNDSFTPLHFQGGDAALVANNYPAIDLSSIGTVEAWIFLDTLTAIDINQDDPAVKNVNAGLVMSIDGSGNGLYGLRFHHSELIIFVGGGGSFDTDTVRAALTDINERQWHHVAGVWDAPNNIMNLYVDGVLVNSKIISSSVGTAGGGDIYIGSQNPTGILSDNLFGFVRNVRIWNKALSIDEINVNNHFNNPPINSGLVANWVINDVNGTVVNSNGNNATVASGSWQPYSYYWENDEGDFIAHTEDLSNMPDDRYNVDIIDAKGCTTNEWFTIGVNDLELPVFTNCPTDTLFLSTNSTTENCRAEIDTSLLEHQMVDLTGSDNCSYRIFHNYNGIGTTLHDSIFYSGTSEITWTIVDSAGNSNTCNVYINVADGNPPQIVCPEADTIGYCMASTYRMPVPDPYDDCGYIAGVWYILSTDPMRMHDELTSAGDTVTVDLGGYGEIDVEWVAMEGGLLTNNCFTTVYVYEQPRINVVTQRQPSCNGDSDGVLFVSDYYIEELTDADTIVEYRLDAGPWQKSNVFSNLSAGTYSLYVRDRWGCESEPFNVVLNQPGEIYFTEVIDSVDCYEDLNGSIDLTVHEANKAYRFDGAGDYIATRTSYEGLIDTLSFAAWIKVPVGGGGRSIISFDDMTYYEVSINAQKLWFETVGNGTNHVLNSTTALDDDEWHFVAGTFDGVSKYLFIDGVQDTVDYLVHGAGVNPLGLVSDNVYGIIGDGSEATSFNASNTNEFFNGEIAEIAIWDTLLSFTDIQFYYTGGIPDSDKEMKAHWILNDTSQIYIPNLADSSTFASSITTSTRFFEVDGPIFYQWTKSGDISFSETTQDISEIGFGTYNVSIVDVNGCSDDTTYHVGIDDVFPPFFTLATDTIFRYTSDDDLGDCDYIPSGGEFDVLADDNGCDTVVYHNYFPRTDSTSLDGLSFPVDTIDITWRAIDRSGNYTDTIVSYVIIDNEKPAINPPADTTILCESSLDTAIIGNVIITDDNCSNNISDYTFAFGYESSTQVLDGTCGEYNYDFVRWFTVTDEHGNDSTVYQNVYVRDTIAPLFSTLASDTIMECDGSDNPDDFRRWVKNHGGARAADACSPFSWTIDADTTGVPSWVDYGCINDTVRYIDVSFFVTDSCANQDTTSARFWIVDTSDPVWSQTMPVADTTILCHQMFDTTMLYADDICVGGITAVLSGSSSQVMDDTHPGYYTYDSIRTWTASDPCGNIITHTQTIHVVDTVAPTIACPDDIHSFNETGRCDTTFTEAEIGTPVVADQCTPLSNITVSFRRTDGAASLTDPFNVNIDPDTIYWIAEDVTGNKDSCYQLIDIDDNELPQLFCVSDTTIYADENGVVAFDSSYLYSVLPTDNCGIDYYTVTPPSFDCNDAGRDTVVTLVVTDIYTNSATCDVNVYIRDTIDPVAIPEVFTIYLDETGNFTLTQDLIDSVGGNSYDNCPEVFFSVDQVDFTCASIPRDTFIFTITDKVGLSDTRQTFLRVHDTIAPTMQCIAGVDTIFLNNAGVAVVEVDSIDDGTWDGCTTPAILYSKPEKFYCGDLGLQNVTLVGLDIRANEDSCHAQVFVKDTVKPTVVINHVECIIDAETGYCKLYTSDFNNGSFDNCTVDSISISEDGGATWVDSLMYYCGDVGDTYTVWLRLFDQSGNVDSLHTTFDVRQGWSIDEVSLQDCAVFGEEFQVWLIDTAYSHPYSYLWTTNSTPSYSFANQVEPFGIDDSDAEFTSTANFPLVHNDNNGLIDGTYNVDVTVTDTFGCTDYKELEFIWSWADGGTHDTQKYLEVCEGGTYTLSADVPESIDPINSPITDVSWQWHFNDGVDIDLVAGGGLADSFITVTFNYPVDTVTIWYKELVEQTGYWDCEEDVTYKLILYKLDPPSWKNLETADTMVCPFDTIYYELYDEDYTAFNWVLDGGYAYQGGSGFDSTVNVIWDDYSNLSPSITAYVYNEYGCEANSTLDIHFNDVSAPDITCPPDVVRTSTESCGYFFFDLDQPTWSDDCHILQSMENDYNGTDNSNGWYDVGDTIVTWTIEDYAGGVASCQQQISVIDGEAPYFDIIPPDRTVNTQVNCQYTHATNAWNARAYDACLSSFAYYTLSGATTLITGSDETLNGQVFEEGTTYVTWYAEDTDGNVTTHTQTIVVNDNKDPLISNTYGFEDGEVYCFTSLSEAQTYNQTFDLEITDNCAVDENNVTVELTGTTVATISATKSGDIYSFTEDFELGLTHVLWTIVDVNGRAISHEFDVIFASDYGFAITAQADREADVYCNPDEDQFSEDLPIIETIPAWFATLESAGDISAVTDTSSVLNARPAKACENVRTRTYSVQWDVTVNATSNCTYSFTKSDDQAYNYRDDSIAPVIDESALNNLVLECDEDVDFSAVIQAWLDIHGGATASDNCSTIREEDWSHNYVDFVYDCGEAGDTTVTFSVTDTCGNVSTCQADIIIEDTAPPVVSCVDTFRVYLNESGVASISSSPESLNDGSYDECSVESELSFGFNSSGNNQTNYSSADFGDTIDVDLVVFDECGLSDTCSSVVLVFDTIFPTIDCSGLDSIVGNAVDQCDSTLDYTLIRPIINDNVGVDSVYWWSTGATPYSSRDASPPDQSQEFVDDFTFNLGTTTVYYVVADSAHNTDTCSFVVEVNDAQQPYIDEPLVNDSVCTADYATTSIQLSYPFACANDRSLQYSDNCSDCSLVTLEYTISGVIRDINWNVTNPIYSDSGVGQIINRSFELGEYTLTYIVTDTDGNYSTTSMTIKVVPRAITGPIYRVPNQFND